jgi:hypothetical protein
MFRVGEKFVDGWGNEIPDPEEAGGGYADLKVAALKEILAEREAAGREIDTSEVKTKADLIAVLEADDAAQAEEA